ncbi:MAG: hypothetical protein ACFCUM_10695 [Bacteroidales bacterium]
MKQLIYISGVTGGILLILRILGIFVEFSFNRPLLLTGLLLTVVSITFSLIYKDLQNRKIRKLLRKYRDGGSPDSEIRKPDRIKESKGEKMEKGNGDDDEKKAKSGEKGFEPGKTSLRKKKSGLVWEGGNIKGTTAARGTKRRFIKRW